MPTFADGESLATVRTKINDAITTVDALDQGVATTDSPTFAGLTTTADITFGDNDKAIFGAGSDLQIYHDGSNSHFVENGTGNLVIRGTNISFANSAWTENYATFTENGAVTLYYDNAAKLATTSTGVDVTGTVTADELTVSGDSVTIATSKTPASATDTGTTGEVAWDANYIYVCTATNTWVRAALATW